jgi:hypothetical protein
MLARDFEYFSLVSEYSFILEQVIPKSLSVMWGKTQDHGGLGDKQSGGGMRT